MLLKKKIQFLINLEKHKFQVLCCLFKTEGYNKPKPKKHKGNPVYHLDVSGVTTCSIKILSAGI